MYLPAMTRARRQHLTRGNNGAGQRRWRKVRIVERAQGPPLVVATLRFMPILQAARAANGISTDQIFVLEEEAPAASTEEPPGDGWRL